MAEMDAESDGAKKELISALWPPSPAAAAAATLVTGAHKSSSQELASPQSCVSAGADMERDCVMMDRDLLLQNGSASKGRGRTERCMDVGVGSSTSVMAALMEVMEL